VKQPHKIKLYNLPQRIEGGIKIHGFKNKEGKDITILFHHLDGMYSYCTIQDPEAPNDSTGEVVHLNAATSLIEMGNDEYKIDEEETQEKEY
jgi:hypothetical protein